MIALEWWVLWMLLVGAANFGFVLGVWWAKNWARRVMDEAWTLAHVNFERKRQEEDA